MRNNYEAPLENAGDKESRARALCNEDLKDQASHQRPLLNLPGNPCKEMNLEDIEVEDCLQFGFTHFSLESDLEPSISNPHQRQGLQGMQVAYTYQARLQHFTALALSKSDFSILKLLGTRALRQLQHFQHLHLRSGT